MDYIATDMNGLCNNKQSPLKKTSSVFTLLLLFILWGNAAFAQTPVTQYPCDPRSTANGGNCPASCTFAANIERGCNCFDNIDNDGDGQIDSADPNCAAYFGLEFVGEGSDCSITPPGANTPYDLVGNPIKSAQNTADTQSKVAVGDVDGDGIPDAVITSKWNREVRVVATSDGQPDGSDAGDIKADFKTTGAGATYFAGGDKLLFEHEVLIADIDKDGKAEIFAVVSSRGGNPSTPPTHFYLIGFRYTKGANGLIPLYNAINLGTNRPGTFGIADMDGDGKAEIYLRDRVFAAETGKLLASEGAKTMSNTSLWDVDVTSAPVAIDIKTAGADGFKMELIVGNRIYKVPNLTNRNPASPAALTLWRDMNTIPFDINGDGVNDKYFVKLMSDPIEYGVDTHSSVSVADVDKDGFVDVILSGALNSATGRTTVFYWNVRNNTVSGFMTETSAQLGIPPASNPDYNNYLNGWVWGTGRVNIGDVNGDGQLDLIFIAGARLYAKTISGNNIVALWPQSRVINDSRSGVLTVTIYDFDNDGKPELVYRDSQELAIVDGATGWNNAIAPEFSRTCQSHTYTEGPIIADVNGDGATDICITCNTSNSFNISDPIQQQALGQIRMYFSSGNEWLPTRKVWNQPGYFVVNINDDLTLPFPQFDISTNFGNTPCPNGIPGPNTPFNVFLNQVPYLSANGCPVFPAPDLTFIGDDPTTYDPNNPDPNFFPAVFVESPICGNVDIKVGFNIGNTGDLPITDNVPVSFFIRDPRTDPTAVRLHTSNIVINNLQIGDTLKIGDYTDANGVTHPGDQPFVQFSGPGTTFTLYIVLNNDGSVLPIASSGQTANECKIENNVYPILVEPRPFTVNIDSIPNVKCLATSPDAGELISHISIGPDTVVDLSPYAFQWYESDATTPIAGATNYNLTGLAAGDYYLVITNTQKMCQSDPILGQVTDGNLVIPGLTVTKLSDQTTCEPPDGSLKADVTGGNAGFEFEWEDIGGPIGVTGPLLENVRAGTYTVIVTESSSGCSTSADGSIADFTQEPDVVASKIDVINCVNASSGEVTATAFFNGVEQDSTNYRFDWYIYDKASETRGSILPGSNGNPTVKNLPIGYYEVEITELATGCTESNPAPDTVEIKDMTLLPSVSFTELAPQTSCDPNQPNGRLQANAIINGVVQDPANFTFEWFEGQNTVTPHVGGTSGVNGQVAEAVKGGGQAYTVRITTANQCSVTKDTVINEIIVYPQVSLSTTPNSVCDQTLGFTGSVSSVVTFDGNNITSPNPDYTFKWYNGSVVNPANERVADLNKQSITQLDSGFYTLVVENTVLHCPSVASVEQVLSIKALPAISIDSDSSTNCAPNMPGNGRAFVTDVDNAGTGSPYVYQWYSTTDTTGNKIINATNFELLNLQGGPGVDFTVWVRNNTTGCENIASVGVADAHVIPQLTAVVTPDNICDVNQTAPGITRSGAIDITITNQGATPITDYQFSWVADESGVGPFSTQNLAQIDSGSYTLTVLQTVTGCESTPLTRFVPSTTSFPIIQTLGTASTNCAPNMPGNGSVEVTDIDGNGLAGDYRFQWYTTSDTTGTILTDSISSIMRGIQGGAGVEFTVLVVDRSNGCSATAIEQVLDNKLNPNITLTATPNQICNAALTNPPQQNTGNVNSTITNLGTAPLTAALSDYRFTWIDLETGAILKNGISGGANQGEFIANLDSSRYSLRVIHSPTGCESNTAIATVDLDITLPVVTASTQSSTNCLPAFADGEGFVTSVDGVDPAVNPQNNIFQWYATQDTTGTKLTSETNFRIINRQGGPDEYYTVLVTDQDNGCQNTATVKILDAKTRPVITLGATDNTQCAGTPNGSAFLQSIDYKGTLLTRPNAFTGFTFGWASGESIDSIVNKQAGTYKLAVTSNVGCTSDTVSVQVLNNLVIPAIVFSKQPQTSCDINNLNGDIEAGVTAIGVTAGHTFNWFTDNGATAPLNNANIEPGNPFHAINLPGNLFYTLVVQNSTTLCADTSTTFLQEILRRPVITVTATDIVDCNTPGFVTASAAIDLDDNGVDDPIDFTNPANVARYAFTWYRGTSNTDPQLTATTTNVLTKLDDGVTDLPVGNYAAFVIDTQTSCSSQVEFDYVNGPPPLFGIAANANIRPASCGPETGSITAYVTTGGPTTTNYTFEWYQGAPVDPSKTFYTDPPVQFSSATPLQIDQFGIQNTGPYTYGPLVPLPAGMQPSTSATTGPTLYGRATGTYTVVVTDANGCKEYLQTYLPFQTEPIILVADIIPTECGVENGAVGLTIDPDPSGTSGNTADQYKLWLIEGSNPTLSPPSDPATFLSLIQPATGDPALDRFTGLGPRVYTVVAQEDITKGLPNGCFSAPVTFTMVSALPPNLSALAFNANSSCGGAPGDGSIQVTFSMREDDPYHPNYVPQPTPPASFPVFAPVTYDIAVLDVDDNVTTNFGPFNNGDIVMLPNLQNGDFDVTVNSSVGCSITKRYTVDPEPVVAELVEGDLTIDDSFKCDPDGAIEVTTIGIVGQGPGSGVINEYVFRWFATKAEADANSNAISSAQGDANPDLGGDYFDATALSRPAGIYWVVAEKNVGSGIGCLSAPFSGEIKDLSKNPVGAMAAFSNTACTNPLLPPVFEGSLRITVSDAGSLPAITGYQYDWLSATPSSGLNGTSGNGDADGDGSEPDDDNPTGLENGFYQVRITNLETGCFTTANGTIDQTELPVIISQTAFQNQEICFADGSVEVLQVLVNNNPAPIADFEFTWYRGSTTTPTVLTGLGETLLDAGTYVDPGDGSEMGAGTYNVVAVRINSSDGGPGYGCPSPQKTETVLDKSKDPVMALTPFVNTSCSPTAFEGSIEIRVTDEGSLPAAGLGYRYTWTSFPAASSSQLADPDPFDDNDGDADGSNADGDQDNPSGLSDGTFKLVARNNTTGCLSNEVEAVITPSITPVIIAQKGFLDRFVCDDINGAGRAFVTQVTVQSATPVTYNQINPPIPVGAPPFSTDLRFAFYEGVPLPDSSNLVFDGLGESHLDSLRLLGIKATSYYVVVQNKIGPGLDCKSVAERIDITDRSLSPEFNMTPSSNTSCDLAVFDGSLSIVVTTPGSLPATNGYDYTWVTTPVPGTPANSDPNNLADNFNGDGAGADGDNPVGLKDGTYTLRIVNANTQCVSRDVSSVIGIEGRPQVVTSLQSLDRLFCVESGKVLVNAVKVGNTSFNNTQFNPQFSFEFFEGSASGTSVLQGVNAFQLDSVTYAHPNPAEELKPGVSYFVVTTNLSGVGLSCQSVPASIQILDKHVNPIPSLQSVANSSCNMNFNGIIRLTANDNAGPGVGGMYTYDWDQATNPFDIEARDNAGNPIPNNNGDGVGPDGDEVQGLPEGTYTLQVINQVTQCLTPASVEIKVDLVASQPNIITVDKNLPFDCLGNGGDATVTEIRIGAGPSITGSPNLDPPNFQYDWYDNTTDAFANPSVPGTVPNGAPTNGRFLTMLQHGRYFVKVRDLVTDCQSKPVEVFIDSLNIVYPKLSIRQTTLQLSCDVTLGTASLKALADGQDDSNPDYFFTWYNNLDATDPAFSDPFISTDSIGDLLSGNYSVKVLRNSTGCESDLFFIVPNLDPKFLPNMALSGDAQTSCMLGVDNGSVVVRVLPFPTTTNGLTYPFPFDFKVDLYNGDQTNSGLDQEPPAFSPDKMADMPALPFSPPPGSFIADPVGGGTYTVRLRDNNTGCILVEATEVLKDLRDPIPTVVPENPLTNCDTRFNGQLSVTADGRPVGDYNFAWWSGLTNPPGVGDTLSTNDKLIGVNQGQYFVRVVNKASGCDSIASGTVSVNQVFPPSPSVVLIQPQTICWEDFYPADPAARPNGWLAAHVNNQTLGYRFDWYQGNLSTVQGLTPDTTGINNLHLEQGFYTVNAVILETGCASLTVGEVPDARIIPQGIVETTPSYCADVSPTFTGTGSVLLKLTGNREVALRTVDWFNDDTNANIGSGIQVFELEPGVYRAEMITNEYCVGTATGEVKTEILSYNLVSANGDNSNDTWIIDCISNYPNNNVKVFNRYGVKVFEINGYDNQEAVFRGIGENGLYSMGNDLPDGTYFYVIDKRDGSKPITGFLELVR